MSRSRCALRAALGAAALAVVLAAPRAPASADPVLRRITTQTDGGRLVVVVESALATRGKAVVTGTVNGRRVRVRKAVKAGERTSRLVVDPRRARVRRSDGPLDFQLTVRLAEGGDQVEEPVHAQVGVPLLVLPGLGNELTPGGFETFLTALDAAAGGAWGVGRERASARVFEYPSLDLPLTELTEGLDAAARKALRGSVFRQVDVVGYSMGGLVAREWLRNGGKGRVRRLVFLGTPNEGAPIAFFGVLAANTGVLDQVVGNAAGGELAGALGFLLNDRTSEALTTFLPTYDWATLSLLPGILPPREVPSSELNALLLGTTAPLEALNAVPPDAKAEMHAFFYTSVPTEALGVEIGTIDRVDLTPLVAGLAGGLGGDTLPDLSGVDLAALATGEGDGVVPAHSVRMDGVPAWRDRIVPHDLGAGVHVTLPLDPNVFVQVAAVLTQ